ncbi:hypothetical protein SKAU_G00332790 [Synaphobranchus kaupii]|uniref:ALK tyrosine kinase receptor n=1 Tax=Synaphobranchus kaupii TaxID=118154 RepID=A0A9Q1ELG9_SYNKA|nr:hypothetical protein SKAU_G00332790 [Synaphobranchus kaupii]
MIVGDTYGLKIGGNSLALTSMGCRTDLVNNSGDTSSKKDANQTYNSRLKRKTLSVDFAIPSLLRNYLSVFIKRPLNGDCRNFNGCYAVRSNLRMHCIPLQKIVSSLLETNLAESDGLEKENITGAGQLPYRHKRPLSSVLNLGLTRKTNQVVVEVGEELVRTLCGGLTSEDDAPFSFMEMDLSSIMEWWLGAEGGRLRIRIMPEKRAQVPGKEEKYSAAIRAADPRLFLEIASRDMKDDLLNCFQYVGKMDCDGNKTSEDLGSGGFIVSVRHVSGVHSHLLVCAILRVPFRQREEGQKFRVRDSGEQSRRLCELNRSL